MLKRINGNIGLLISGLACILLGVIIGIQVGGGAIEASSSTPGSVDDPLAAKSYVDTRIAEAISNIDLANVDQPVTEPTPDPEPGSPTTGDTIIINEGSLFVVEFIPAGQKLVVEASGEVILRAGTATAIGNAGGDGISDVTTGYDIADGEEVPLNHHIIIPRTDGRGLYITQDAYIMVKGQYSIEN